MTELEAEHFAVFENRQVQQLAYFYKEQVPVSVGLILDVSGSMTEKIDKARFATAQFLESANPEDEYFLISFNERPALVSEFTHNTQFLLDEFNSIAPAGNTALFDAIHLGLQEMQRAKHSRRALLVISDGGDNQSRYTKKEIQKAVREADTVMFCIGIRANCVACRNESAAQKLLQQLAKMAGGRHYDASDPYDLPGIARTVNRVLRSGYILGYRSTGITLPRNRAYRKAKTL
jgi:Ca-activated chloride channel family protein